MVENYILESDVNVVYIDALSFPEGIMDAHKNLHSIVPFSKERRYFGLSRPEMGVIIYKAAAEVLNKGEFGDFSLPAMVIHKGNYVSIYVKNFPQDLSLIQKSFDILLKQPGLDPKGYCVEWYVNDTDLICMIRLQNDVLK